MGMPPAPRSRGQGDVWQVVLGDGNGAGGCRLPKGLPRVEARQDAPVVAGQISPDAQGRGPRLLRGGEGSFGATIQAYPTRVVGTLVGGFHGADLRRRGAQQSQCVGGCGEGGAGLQLRARADGDTEPIRHVKCWRERRNRTQYSGINAAGEVYRRLCFRPYSRPPCFGGVNFKGEGVAAIGHRLTVVVFQSALYSEGADDPLRGKLGGTDHADNKDRDDLTICFFHC